MRESNEQIIWNATEEDDVVDYLDLPYTHNRITLPSEEDSQMPCVGTLDDFQNHEPLPGLEKENNNLIVV